MERIVNPLSIQFNAAVQTIVRRLGLSYVPVSSDDAPSTYEEVVRSYHRHNDILFVAREHSDRTIFDDKEINYAFRAWHDYRHITGKHDFSLEGEKCTAIDQIKDMWVYYGNNAQTRVWSAYIWGDVVGQRLYADNFGHFPVEQKEFVMAYVNNPTYALSDDIF